jgi:hypothetical protein
LAKDEVRDVFRNATNAMLGHQTSSIEPIAGFIVATNRPIGMFGLIAGVGKRCRAKSDDDDPFLTFSESIAPDELFSTDSTNSGKSGRRRENLLNRRMQKRQRQCALLHGALRGIRRPSGTLLLRIVPTLVLKRV